ncbi:MAG: triose-phosphate isomerase [Actinomycetota bacterium]|nr:triose-phosphate isomerase [Actinomycetota bacterium]
MMAGNWKMYKDAAEAVELVQAIGAGLTGSERAEVVVCPPFTALAGVGALIESRGSNIALGAQNMNWEEEGALTGEISPLMLRQLGVTYVILGHSERRQYFSETDATVNKKILAALEVGLKPIFCVGETREQRESGAARDVIGKQITGGLTGVTGSLADRLIVAYEPVWAIGTGLVAEPQDANDMIRHIRAIIGSSYGVETAQAVRILYGGSVKPANVSELMDEPEIDGALVGGASLDADSFLSLLHY